MNSRFLSRLLNCYAKKSKESNLLSVVKMVSNPLTPINDRYVISLYPEYQYNVLQKGDMRIKSLTEDFRFGTTPNYQG